MKAAVTPLLALAIGLTVAGGILACLYINRGRVIDWLREKRHWLFSISFVHLILVLIFVGHDSAFLSLYQQIALCCCTFSVVLLSVFGWGGPVGYITRNRFIQYIGMISYGIYLYHMPVPFVYRSIAAKYFPSFHMAPWTFMVFCFALTIGIAALSYRYIETPFLRLKRYFAY